MKKIFIVLSLFMMISLTGCGGKDVENLIGSIKEESQSGESVVGYTNHGAVDRGEMTELKFERIHYGAAVIQEEDKFLFAESKNYQFPGLITSEEEWDLLQKKLNIDLGDVDFDEYIVFGEYEYDLWKKTNCSPVLIEKMAYNDQTLYYGWRPKEGRHFEAENKEDRLCGFDLVKIKRSDFPMESRDIFGSSMQDEEPEENATIFVESGGYYLLY